MSEAHCVNPVYDCKRWIQKYEFGFFIKCQKICQKPSRTNSQPTGNTPQSQLDEHQWPRPATSMDSTGHGQSVDAALHGCSLHTEQLGVFL